MIFDNERHEREYAAFIRSMISFCHCEPESRRPCDGVLAGGLCDGHREDQHEEDEDEDDEP